MQTLPFLVLALGWQGVASGSVLPQARNINNNEHLFATPDLAIPEAPASHQLTLGSHPNPDVLGSPARARVRAMQAQYERQRRDEPAKKQSLSGTNAITNTIYSGVYPVINVTWGNKAGAKNPGQSFVSFVDTGSSDTFAVSKKFQCLAMQSQTAAVEDDSQSAAAQPGLSQAACNFGALYDADQGNFTNITAQAFSISYFPEMESLDGSMVLAPISVGGLTVPQQQVALVEAATWTGDGVTSGLLGLSYPALTAGQNRSNGLPAPAYNPFFTNLARQQINGQDATASAVFALAIDRVPRGTPYWQAAGTLALGGLVPSSYYEGNFTSVPIEPPWSLPATSSFRAFYATTVQVVYGPPGANGTSAAMDAAAAAAASPRAGNASALSTSPAFQTIVDSGTSPNFVPTAPAVAINGMFDPPARFNKTLNYYLVDCDAKAPYVAFRIGGKTTGRGVTTTGGVLMPMDPRDMIVRSLNGLPGFDDVCFSSIANGGSQYSGQQIIGSTWQRSYVVAYDQGRSMLHFARRRPY